MWPSTASLLDDAKSKTRHPGTLDHPGAFQFDRLRVQIVEEPDTLPEEDGHEVDAYFVDQPGLDALPRDVHAAYADVLVSRGHSRLLDGAFDAVRDEDEG